MIPYLLFDALLFILTLYFTICNSDSIIQTPINEIDAVKNIFYDNINRKLHKNLILS